jgi:hypothetical protein
MRNLTVSNPSIKKYNVFISAEQSALDSAHNAELTLILQAYLKREGYKPTLIDGSYEGRPEQSFMVSVTGQEEVDQLKFVSRKFNQEAVLVVDRANNSAVLHHWLDGQIELGTLKRIDNDLRNKNYSIINGNMFIVE